MDVELSTSIAELRATASPYIANVLSIIRPGCSNGFSNHPERPQSSGRLDRVERTNSSMVNRPLKVSI